MESNGETPRTDAASAQAALDSITTDRSDIGARFTKETWWAAPGQGAGVALLVAAPAPGLPWMAVLSLAGVIVLLVVEIQFRKRTGLTISRPAGPLGWTLAILAVVVMAGGVVASTTLSLAGPTQWIPALVAAAFVLTALIVVLYDRAYAHEVTRVR
ncbi:hypothetical protein [Pseudactinotalea sp.]|uniref:hypothetical protein n=1 Tax=Pseudactinotalea sp. TaxID=1926260 RepID=UPI003B3B02A9